MQLTFCQLLHFLPDPIPIGSNWLAMRGVCNFSSTFFFIFTEKQSWLKKKHQQCRMGIKAAEKGLQLSQKLQILGVFSLLKTLYVCILLSSSAQFDLSSKLYSLPGSSTNFGYQLNKLRNWDAVYFAKLMDQGATFEHEWVFVPFLWRFIRFITSLLHRHDFKIHSFMVGIAMSNLSQLASAYILYDLTLLKFGDKRAALRSSVLFLLSTVGIFGMGPYGENFNTLNTFLGLYILERSRVMNSSLQYLCSSMFFLVAFWTRSNSVLLGVIYFYDFIMERTRRSLLAGLVFGLGIVYYHYVPYVEFCSGGSPRPWCLSPVPSIYTYAQSRYWNVGFLKYWTPNNLLNFAIASPEILLLVQSTAHFANRKNAHLVWLTVLHVVLVVFFVHTQIALRVSSFIPLQYWYLSSLLADGRGKYWITWLITWGAVQGALFVAFLPPA